MQVLTRPSLITYGCPQPKKTQLGYDAWAFIHYEEADESKPPRHDLFWRVHDRMTPGWMEKHAWTLAFVEAACAERYIGLMGCAGSAKTRNAVGFSCISWRCAANETSVIIASTTVKSLRKRAWAEVCSFHNQPEMEDYGRFVDSQTLWRSEKGDDRAAIFGMAVAQGNVNDAAANIQGIHSKYQIVLLDEAEAADPPIWISISNLWSYPITRGGRFLLIACANPRSRLSRFGIFCAPKGGWPSVDIETDTWEANPPMADDPTPARVLRFDFRKSPNYLADKQVSKHLPSKRLVKSRLETVKSKGAENDPEYWAFSLGFPAPEGLIKTIFTELLLEKHDGYGHHEFTGASFTLLGTYDPAQWGDRPTVRFFVMGEIVEGGVGLESLPPIVLYPDATSKDPVSYQLIAQVRYQAQHVKYRERELVCQPGNFGMDITGAGGTYDVARSEWSPEIVGIEFNGAASPDPCSHEDPRLAVDVYDNKRAEMFFRARNALRSGQLKGIDKDTAVELCSLQYDDSKAHTILEKKADYKKRMQQSPDLADTLGMGLEIARLRGFKIKTVGLTAKREVEWTRKAQKVQDAFDDREAFKSENYDLQDDAYLVPD